VGRRFIYISIHIYCITIEKDFQAMAFTVSLTITITIYTKQIDIYGVAAAQQTLPVSEARGAYLDTYHY